MCVPFCITDKYGRRLDVPCGKCFECLRDKQQQWCFRLDVENRLCNNSFFVTFTYDDEHLTFADDEPCLCKRDFQLFMKKLRKHLEPKSLKYYCVGEYGEQYRVLTPNGRPHYHALLFYYGSMDRFELHQLIKRLWFFGIAQVLPVTGAQGYVTKYVMKFDKREHLVPPFSLISQGLGIGYLTPSMVKYHQRSLQSFAVKPGGYKITLPRYYKDKIFNSYQKLVMKSRADLHRKELEILEADKIDMLMSLGINYFKEEMNAYKNRLYQSLKLYRQKHKL